MHIGHALLETDEFGEAPSPPDLFLEGSRAVPDCLYVLCSLPIRTRRRGGLFTSGRVQRWGVERLLITTSQCQTS